MNKINSPKKRNVTKVSRSNDIRKEFKDVKNIIIDWEEEKRKEKERKVCAEKKEIQRIKN